jgi:membrane protein DedA with SNARE-associated domain
VWPNPVVAGYAGIAFLMFLENILPPIPSEVIMPAAGYRAAQGDLSLPMVIVAGTAGSLAGAWFWYWLASRAGEQRVRRWIARRGYWVGLYPSDLDRSIRAFDKHGAWIVGVARMVPGVRTLISVPAGLAGMRRRMFLLASTIGTAAWTTALTYGGYALGQEYERLGTYLHDISTVVLVALVAWVIIRAIRIRRKRRAAK